MNACREAGLPVRLRHGIVLTRAGYVLPLEDGHWVARTRSYSPFGEDEDEDDD